MFDFKELFRAFREDDMMETLLNEFSLMIEDARWMFEVIGEALVSGGDPKDHKEEIYSRDIRINKTERSIRKKIIEHLSLNPGSHLGTCLVLFSAAKDAERLGDYCKNLQEVAEWLEGKSYPDEWFEQIKSLHKKITKFFTRTALVFTEVNVDEARSIMEEVRELNQQCDQIVKSLLNQSSDHEAASAVATTLTIRYFKRTAAHIGNIASGIVNPVHKIDYLESSSKKNNA